RRAFDSPMAIACLLERAPCLPFRMCSISSLTNSPACVLADFPALLSAIARFNVCFSGISCLLSHVRRLSNEYDVMRTILDDFSHRDIHQLSNLTQAIISERDAHDYDSGDDEVLGVLRSSGGVLFLRIQTFPRVRMRHQRRRGRGVEPP